MNFRIVKLTTAFPSFFFIYRLIMKSLRKVYDIITYFDKGRQRGVQCYEWVYMQSYRVTFLGNLSSYSQKRSTPVGLYSTPMLVNTGKGNGGIQR